MRPCPQVVRTVGFSKGRACFAFRGLKLAAVTTHKPQLVTAFICLLWASVLASDTSVLKPPAGAKTGIVLFIDLQWPDCAAAYPLILDVAKSRNVPVVLHDFPLPRHNWSFAAAVNARFFDQKSQQLGDEFRGYILENQRQITDEVALQRFTEKFTAERQITLPAALDPDKKLEDEVRADFILGQRIGLEHTPTVFVVSDEGDPIVFVESVDRIRLERAITDAQKKAAASTPPKPAAKHR